MGQKIEKIMETTNKIEKIKTVLTPTGDLVFATSNKKGKVHICIMSWVLSDNNTLLLSCEKTSSRVRNIKENLRVGMSIFEKQEKPSLLMYGIASILKGKEASAAYEEILKKAPHYKVFLHKDRCFIKVKITKIIYEYYGGEKEEYFEVEGNFKL